MQKTRAVGRIGVNCLLVAECDSPPGTARDTASAVDAVSWAGLGPDLQMCLTSSQAPLALLLIVARKADNGLSGNAWIVEDRRQ